MAACSHCKILTLFGSGRRSMDFLHHVNEFLKLYFQYFCEYDTRSVNEFIILAVTFLCRNVFTNELFIMVVHILEKSNNKL